MVLPANIAGQTDVNRLLRELTGLSDFFTQAAARQAGTSIVPPKTTLQLDNLAKANKLNLFEDQDRSSLARQLINLLTEAPKLRISFAVDPPPKVVESIVGWLRQNVDPGVLLQVGLQPNIGAGCVLRTPNREFDLSIRKNLKDSKKYLAELIQNTTKKAEAISAPTVQLQQQPPHTN